jgi:hypothetical protein
MKMSDINREPVENPHFTGFEDAPGALPFRENDEVAHAASLSYK